MVILNKIDGNEILVNCDEIETIEKNHDTTISLRSGKKVIVKQSFDEIIQKVVDYKKLIFNKELETK